MGPSLLYLSWIPNSDSYQNRNSTALFSIIDVSLQEGKFILNDICLDSDYEYITKAALQAKCPGLFIVKAKVDRLEIILMLKETSAQEEHETGTAPTSNSSFVWRAMKYRMSTSDGLAVSLLAEMRRQPGTIPENGQGNGPWTLLRTRYLSILGRESSRYLYLYLYLYLGTLSIADVTEGGFNRCVDLPDWQVDINHMGTVDCGNT